MSNPLCDNNGIYTSPRPPISFPQTPHLSISQFLFQNIRSHSHNNHDSPALIDPNEPSNTLTFSDLKTQVNLLSHSLLKLNISKKDVVLIFAPNSTLFPVAFLAVTAIGAIATTANPLYTLPELTHQINDSKPKLIITVDHIYPKIKPFNLPSILLSLPNQDYTPPNLYYYSDIISNSLNNPLKLANPVTQDDVAAIFYSSGTTGLSKGVVLTHRNFIVTALMVTSDQDVYKEGRNMFLCVVPMFHILGFTVIVYGQLSRGNSVVVMAKNSVVVIAKFELEKFLEAIERCKVTHMFGAPPVVLAFVKYKEVVKRYDMSSLRLIGSGAAPLGKDVMEECAKVFPHAAIFQVTDDCLLKKLNSRHIISWLF